MTNTHSFIVTGSRQQWGLIVQELVELGISSPVEGGVGISFEGTLEDAYRVCLWSRLANRVLMPIKRFQALNQDELYSGVQLVDWYEHIPENASIAVGATVDSNQALNHSQFVALKTKDAIVDQLRELTGARPNVNTEEPDVRIFVGIRGPEATLSLDLSGHSLHRRGYRLAVGQAPLKETVAAAILVRSHWMQLMEEGAPLVDPMCGSGTLCLEAAAMATDLAPGLHRTYYGFLGWNGHDRKAWSRLLEEAHSRHQEGRKRKPLIFGYDESRKSIQISQQNAETANLSSFVRFKQVPLHKLTNPMPEAERGLAVMNPPWGERLGTESSLRSTYVEIGARLKREFGGWQATLITSNEDLGRSTGLKAHRINTLYNGPIKCTVLHFDIHAARSDSEGVAPIVDSPFGNRLKKNVKRLKKWAKREGISCYRIYDRDLPEFAVAIDYYEGDLHIQEYEAPREISPRKAQARLDHILRVIPEVLDIPAHKIHLKVRQRQRGLAQYEKQNTSNRFFKVYEGAARFWVNLEDYLDTGLFLDHRKTRALIAEHAADRHFLNLFAYTGTATVHAALGGAKSTTTVDMSNTYLDWADKNFELNGMPPREHRLIRDDCMHWLRDADERYGLIFLDPPTFSNSKKMENTFDVQRDHVELIRLAMDRLEPDGLLIFTNNYRRFKLDTESLHPLEIETITEKTLPEDFNRNKRIHQSWLIRHPRQTP